MAFANDTSETIEKINSLKNKMDENELQENEDEEENSINESLTFSSDCTFFFNLECLKNEC